jgi:TolB-like protein
MRILWRLLVFPVLLTAGCTQVKSQGNNPESKPGKTVDSAPTQTSNLLNSNNFDLEGQLKHLVTQISTEMSGSQKTSVAVIEFSDLDGNVNKLGKLFSEELITRLYETKKFNVIERTMLTKVLNEQKLQASGLIDEDSAKKLGKLLGVDSIVTGSISDLSNYIRVNARIINAETGMVFGVASASIVKDESIRMMMGEKNVGLVAQNNHGVTGPVLGGGVSAVKIPRGETLASDSELVPWLALDSFKIELKIRMNGGFYPVEIEGRQPVFKDSMREYRASMKAFPKHPWPFDYGFGLTPSQYKEFREKMLAKGMKEISQNNFNDRSALPRYQTCWIKSASE